MNKATTSHLRKHNETLLLKEIYAHETISRVSLAELTHLSRPSVTELTQNLIKRGLVIEVGQDHASEKVGKKARLLGFNADIHQMIAVGVNDTFITGALLNLRMTVLEQQSIRMNGITSSQAVEQLIELIRSINLKASRPLLGIVLGTPGIIDSDTGMVHLAVNLGWKDLPLAQIMTNTFGVPAYIGNESNMLAISESRFGLGQDIKDLIVVKIGAGIGIGMISNGRLLQGADYAAGELGHTPFPSLNDLCICGRRGCLETVVSWWSLRQQAQKVAAAHPESLLSKLQGDGDITLEIVAQALQMGDPPVVEMVRNVATYLSHALLIMIHLLNPRMVILTGIMVQLGEPFISLVRQMVQAWAFPYMTQEIRILANEQDDLSILLGAGALLLEKELGI